MAPPARPPGAVKLLLDVHHSPTAARRLREQGYDVLAAADDPILAVLDDDELLRASTREERALVTENARDFDRIVRSWPLTGEHHRGVVFTSPRRYHRGSKAYPANLVRALANLAEKPPRSTVDWTFWLP